MKFRPVIYSLFLILSLFVSRKADARDINSDSIGYSFNRYCRDSIPTVPVIVTDSVNQSSHETDSAAFARMPWYKQIIANGFYIHDKRINYPKFPRLLLKIYDWGDKTFNSYDERYVVGVGKYWKVTGKSYNWMESYMLMFSIKSRDRLNIVSDFYYDLGVNVSFMALSIGYTAKLNDFLGQGKKDRSNLNFNFTCSRIYANLDLSSTSGNAKITRFGSYKRDMPYKFNDISHKVVSGEAFYIWNYKHYAHAAAYCFSKYQLRGAGSFLLGFSFNNQNIDINFENLPQEMKEHLPDLENRYHYRYTDYDICGGYAHNWVLYPKRWLINLTLYPAFGYRHSYAESMDRSKALIATSAHMRTAVVYNHKALFASLTGRFDGHFYFNSRYTFFNSIESISLIVGARF